MTRKQKRPLKALSAPYLEEVKKAELKDRTNEDKNSLVSSLEHTAERIAARIDRGMRIDGAAEPPVVEAGDDEEEGAPAKPDETSAIIAQIKDASEKVRYLETTGEPILGLPEPKNEDPPID